MNAEQREDRGARDAHHFARAEAHTAQLAGIDQRAYLSNADPKDVRRLPGRQDGWKLGEVTE